MVGTVGCSSVPAACCCWRRCCPSSEAIAGRWSENTSSTTERRRRQVDELRVLGRAAHSRHRSGGRTVLGVATAGGTTSLERVQLRRETTFECGHRPREVVDLVGIVIEVVELALAGRVLDIEMMTGPDGSVLGDDAQPSEDRAVLERIG